MLWSGMLWMKYIVMISGILMTASFSIGAIAVLYQLTKKPPISE
jgi:hypothetical protein